MFCSDNVREEISDWASIDRLCDEYIDAFAYHVKKTRPKENNIIPKIVEILVSMRDVNDKQCQRTYTELTSLGDEYPVSELVKEMKGLNLNSQSW